MVYDYCVYVIQIDDDPMHVYVGQTCHTPEERLEQHRAGYKSARSLSHAKKLTLRPDLYENIGRVGSRAESEELEQLLAMILRLKGYNVKGGH